MSQPNSNNQVSKGARSSTALSYALPAAFVFLVGGLGLWLAHSSRLQTSNQIANQVQATAAKQRTTATNASAAVTLTPALKTWRETTHVHGLAVNPNKPESPTLPPIMGSCNASRPGSGSGWENSELTTWALLLTPLTPTAFIPAVTHPQVAI